MIATFVIFLREGIEASMIVAILLAYLDRIGQRKHFRDIFIGVGAALLLALAAGVVIFFTVRDYAGTRGQTIFEAVTYLLAAIVLTYMTFWMASHSRTLSDDLKARTEVALDAGARRGLAFIAFQAVGREALETMVFTLAIVFATSGKGVIVGGVAGTVVALVMAYAIYHLGRRLNVSVFFKVMGALLMFFAAGLLADAVQNFQQLGWLPFLDHALWNTGSVLNEDSAVGDIFHSFFGYADQPTILQIAVYVTYLAVALSAFLHLSRRGRPARPAAAGRGAVDTGASATGQIAKGAGDAITAPAPR